MRFTFLLQWFSMTRKHAIIVMADSLYYTKFKLHCRVGKPGINLNSHCFLWMDYLCQVIILYVEKVFIALFPICNTVSIDYDWNKHEKIPFSFLYPYGH